MLKSNLTRERVLELENYFRDPDNYPYTADITVGELDNLMMTCPVDSMADLRVKINEAREKLDRNMQVLKKGDNFIWKPYSHAYCHEIELDPREPGRHNDNGLRIYCSQHDREHPENSGLNVQIRTFKPTNKREDGTSKDMIAGVTLTIQELREILRLAEEEVGIKGLQ